MLEFYQYLPYHINPIAFEIGPFQVGWYSLMYLVGLAVIYLLLRYRIKKETKDKGQETRDKKQETRDKTPNSKLETRNSKQTQNADSKILDTKYQIQNTILDFLLQAFFGALVGGRLGYVLLYNFSYFLENPLATISPFSQITGEFIGIYGMSYHGGLLGVLMVSWFFCWKRKIKLIDAADFIIPAIPAGYFFGRIGNFLNGELYGRMTTKFWGMYFPDDIFGNLRHPSQLYEAFFEGFILFLILWFIRSKEWAKGKLLAFYLIGYGTFRFGIEFFREPDGQLGYFLGVLTLGQILSLVMLIFGIALIWRKKISISKSQPCLPAGR